MVWARGRGAGAREDSRKKGLTCLLLLWFIVWVFDHLGQILPMMVGVLSMATLSDGGLWQGVSRLLCQRFKI